MSHQLKPIRHDLKTTLWCGPAALAAITGQPTSVVREVLRQVTGRDLIKGVHHTPMIRAATRLGCSVLPIAQPHRRYTLNQFYKRFKENIAEGVILVSTTHHYVVLSGRSFIDNHTKVPVPFGEAHCKRCYVSAAWVVCHIETPSNLPAPTVRRPADPYRAVRTEAKQLAAQYGIEVERYENSPRGSSEYWVYPPADMQTEERDCHYGDHLAYDWDEVLSRVKDYVRDITAVNVPTPVTV